MASGHFPADALKGGRRGDSPGQVSAAEVMCGDEEAEAPSGDPETRKSGAEEAVAESVEGLEAPDTSESVTVAELLDDVEEHGSGHGDN